LKWDAFAADYKRNREAYGFLTQVDINDMNRGLFWFCDNAAGWHQSKTVSAIEIVRDGDVVVLRLNLIAEAVEYASDRPIVFGILPHPARPLPEKYRLFERVDARDDRLACTIYDAFRPWPMDPKAGGMKLFPAADPKSPEAGPSWEYAESCIANMKATMPTGYRTMYLSRAWFSCRAGAYDGWEWRSGGMSAASLTPWFVNYLCWEMNEWIGRDIWDAVYLDECYEMAAKNLEAGVSVRLPDGSEQAGVTNWQFRELMKRWRNIFHAHGRTPMLLAHHTYSWQYQGLVFCDSTLDGENAPIVSLRSRDWIDSTSKHRYEVLQNAGLWGVATFYMPFIAEGGFNDKEKSQFPVWQWRMARQAQSQFAHYETATVYQGQGSQVYKAYAQDVLRWGAGDAAVPFTPYWRTDGLLEVDDQGGDTLVSFYRKPGKLLLIASSRKKAPVTLKIRLDTAALGLAAAPAVRQWDSSFEPPEGDDYIPSGKVQEETRELFEKQTDLLDDGSDDDMEFTEDGVEDFLAGEEAVAGRERAALVPKIDGDVLILPVRPRDFRMVVIE